MSYFHTSASLALDQMYYCLSAGDVNLKDMVEVNLYQTTTKTKHKRYAYKKLL